MTRPVTSQQTAHDLGRRALTVALLKLMSWCLLGVASAAPVGASLGQPAVPADSPWLPWLGCWQLVEEAPARTGQSGGASRFADRVVVCLTPSAADAGGVEVTTIADGELVLVETLLADGAQHPVEGTTCTGWRRSTWSGDRARLFARAELACLAGDDEEARRVSGVGLMMSTTTWLDIQLVNSGGRGEITVRRYRRASESTTVDAGATPLPADVLDLALTAAQLASAAELSVNDVIEASAAVDPAIVEAMLVETQASFALDRRALIRLDDSGVPAELIDLMVALSFPDEFVVERPPARTAAAFGAGGGGFVDPFTFSPYGFDRWYPYYASPFGYYYGWSPYNSLYYLGPATSYVIVPDALDGRSSGRAYRGRGYSQIEVREPTTDRRARRRTVPGGTTRTTAESRGGESAGTSGSSGGGQATPGGYTRGGSSGRTAQPRDR